MIETLDAKALRHFITVVRIGSFRGAAEHLNVAPSVVSRQIADIESNVGLQLFNRTARGVIMTEAGELVLEHGQRVIEDYGLLAEQLDQLKGVQQGRIRICCGEGFLADLIQQGLSKFMPVYPSVRYAIELGSTQGVIDEIVNSDADIGVIYDPVIDTRIRSLSITRQPLCLVAPLGHPLLGRERVSLKDCLGGPCALLSKGHGITQLIGRVAADNGIALAPVVETSSIDVLRHFVSAGLGITFLPRFAVSSELAAGAVGVMEMSDTLLVEASAHLIVRARRRLPKSVDRLASFLAQEMMAFKPAS